MTVSVGRTKSRASEDAIGPTLTETWEIVDDEGDACNIGPIDVLNHEDLPKNGMPYDPDGCDSGYEGLRVVKVNVGDVQKDELRGDCWREITIEYKIDNATPQGGRGQPNFNKPDPITWVPSIEVQTNSRRIAADKLPFIGCYLMSQVPASNDPCAVVDPPIDFIGILNPVVTRGEGELAPVASTAGEPFNPPEEIDAYDTHLRLTIYKETWDEDDIYDCYHGAINHDEITIAIPEINFEKICGKHTLFIRDIQGRPGYKEWKDGVGATVSRKFWAVTMDILHRRRGWYVDKLNVGTKRVLKGDSADLPDGLGGVFDRTADFPSGTASTGDILDAHGRPISTAIWLDHQGQPLAEDDVANRWVLRYLAGHEMDFTAEALGIPQPEAP